MGQAPIRATPLARSDRQAFAASGSGRSPSIRGVGHLDIDFKRRYMVAPVHPDDDLFRIEHDVPRDHGQDLGPQQSQQIRLAAQSTFMRQQNLQPFPCDRRGRSAAADAAVADSSCGPPSQQSVHQAFALDRHRHR